MARSRKPARLSLAKVRAGDVFAMPLPDGRWGACRVLQTRDNPRQALVALSPWVGPTPPDLTEPLLRVVLNKTHHSWNNEACLGWLTDPVPAEFARAGTLAPTPAEVTLPESTYQAFANWDGLPYQVLAQWRWDHERDAVLAEDEAAHRRSQEDHERQRHAYEGLSKGTLQELRKRPFKGWEKCIEPEDVRASRKIVRETIDTLLALGPDAPEPSRMNVFHWCVEQFNALDSGWICTIEREDLCDLLSDLADLVGLEEYGEALTGRRDW